MLFNSRKTYSAFRKGAFMGRFIISRSAAGDRFLLQSDTGRTLAVSRNYATLDACKKGIRSLVTYLPCSPIVDASAGETGPNPKCEIVKEGGGYVYFIKSPNGKTLLTCPPMQTKKAVLRALSMLRSGVLQAEVLFWRRAGYTPLTVHLPDARRSAKDSADTAVGVTADIAAGNAVKKTLRPVTKKAIRPADGSFRPTATVSASSEIAPDPVEPVSAPAATHQIQGVSDPVRSAPAETAPAFSEVTPPHAEAAPTPQKPANSPAPDKATPGGEGRKSGIFGKINKVR